MTTGLCPLCQRDWVIPGGNLVIRDGVATTASGSVRLTPFQDRLVRALIRQPMTRERLILVCWPEADGGPLTAGNCLSVQLKLLRGKLHTLGMEIKRIASGRHGETLYYLAVLDAAAAAQAVA